MTKAVENFMAYLAQETCNVNCCGVEVSVVVVVVVVVVVGGGREM